jgi:hypothetical protein
MNRLRSGIFTPSCSETGHNRLRRAGNQPLGEPRRLVENLLEPRLCSSDTSQSGSSPFSE